MGALTLKSFPFELRGWELEKFDSIDLTDSFGSSIKVSLNNKQIILIEPSNNSNWISDKTRQFFDGLNNSVNEKINFNDTIKKLNKNIYLFHLCLFKNLFINYVVIVYQNLSINDFCLLTLFSQKYFFIKLKKSENINFNNNLESSFLFNKNKIKLNNSSLCLLISNNPRNENSNLNLNLKQRLLKGHFKLFLIGSFINLTYNVKFLGKTSSKIIKVINEGTHFICQDFKFAKNPIILINSKLLKKNENYSKIFSNLTKISLNILNSTIFEVSSYLINKPKIINYTDFFQFSTIYFINVTTSGNSIINKIFKTNIIFLNKHKTPNIKKLFLNQNFYKNKNLFKKFIYLPTNTFFETKGYFLNNYGSIKYTTKLVSKNKSFSNWKIIRNIFNNLKKNHSFILDYKTKFKVNFNFKNRVFKIFKSLNFEPCKNLNKNQIGIFKNNNVNYFIIKFSTIKIKKIKFFNTKTVFWLNDFFIGGNDEFSKKSLVMVKNSKIARFQNSNFF